MVNRHEDRGPPLDQALPVLPNPSLDLFLPHEDAHVDTEVGAYLLPLLNVGYRVRLKIQLVCAAQLPIEDDDNHSDHQHWDDHANHDPQVAAL